MVIERLRSHRMVDATNPESFEMSWEQVGTDGERKGVREWNEIMILECVCLMCQLAGYMCTNFGHIILWDGGHGIGLVI